MYRIEKYKIHHYSQWNEYIGQSKNGTFLFHRDFMEYHSDRFEDFSLLVFDKEKLIAVLPAHKAGNEVHSHMGLTYGGLIYDGKIRLAQVILMVREIMKFLADNSVTGMLIKPVPSIYHKLPAAELDYALFVAGANLVRRDSLCVIDMENRLPVTKTRRECIRRGQKQQLEIVEEPEFALFWDEILIPNLEGKHGIKPVHTVSEIEALHEKFPLNIRHFNVYHEGKIVAGTTVFITDTVAHPQYISGQKDKNELGSLDYLYHYLITEVFADKKYFDFGISNEEQGRKLNEGLVFWKESFGARTMVHDFYHVDTSRFELLDNVLI